MRIQILELPPGDAFVVVISEVTEKVADSLRLAVKEMPASEIGAKAVWVFEDRVDLGPPLPELKVIEWGEPKLPTAMHVEEAMEAIKRWMR